jgi:hypothetical protein
LSSSTTSKPNEENYRQRKPPKKWGKGSNTTTSKEIPIILKWNLEPNPKTPDKTLHKAVAPQLRKRKTWTLMIS